MEKTKNNTLDMSTRSNATEHRSISDANTTSPTTVKEVPVGRTLSVCFIPSIYRITI